MCFEIIAMVGCYFGIVIIVMDTGESQSQGYSLTMGIVGTLVSAASIALGSIYIY